MIEKINIEKSSTEDICEKVNEIIDFINKRTQAEIDEMKAELKFLERSKSAYGTEGFYGKFL